MKRQNLKVIIAAMYGVLIGAVGLTGGATSVSGWVVLGGLALLPAFTMLVLRNHASQTLSQAIQEARR